MAADKATVDRLAAVELFRHCSRKDLGALAAIVEEKALSTGDVLCDQGRVADGCFIVIEGEAEVSVSGKVVVIAGPGQPIGEMGLLDHLPRSATVTARTPMSVYVIAADKFEKLLASTAISRGLLEHMSRRIRDLEAGRGTVAV